MAAFEKRSLGTMCEVRVDVKRAKVKPDEIELLEKEQKILNALQKVSHLLNLQITFRIVGGWVRDKLLGRFSDDIDIALWQSPCHQCRKKSSSLDSLLVAEEDDPKELFPSSEKSRACEGECTSLLCAEDLKGGALKGEVDVEKFCALLNEQRRKDGLPLVKIGVVRPNPALHKRTLVATLHLFGQAIDVLSLRHGSLENDARDRDATLNALYYNVNEKKIEDPTGLGLLDLEKGYLRTPKEAMYTLQVDPLRSLRAIRFACKFDYTLDIDLEKAIRSQAIQDALTSPERVSRERIAKEARRILTCQDTRKATHLLASCHLFPCIFLLPEKQKSLLPTPFDWNMCTHGLGVICNFPCLFTSLSEEERSLLLTAAAMFPFRGVPMGKGRGKTTLVATLLVDGLRGAYTSRDAKNVSMMMEEMNQVHDMVDKKDQVTRLDLGLFVRRTKTLWRTTILVALCATLASQPRYHQLHVSFSEAEMKKVKALQASFMRLEKLINSYQLENAHTLVPLCKGDELCKALSLPVGRIAGRLIESQIRFQLMHPQGTVEACIDSLRREYQKEIEQHHKNKI